MPKEESVPRLQAESTPGPSSSQGFSANGFILNSLEKHQGIIIGESYKSTSAKTYLCDFMYLLKQCGVKTIFMHHLLQEFQVELDEYFNSDGTYLGPRLLKHLAVQSNKQNLVGNSTFSSLIIEAKKHGIRVVALDTPKTYYEGSLLSGEGLNALEETGKRYQEMNQAMCKIISENSKDDKYVVLVESGQVATFMKKEGLSETLGCPHVVIEDLKISNAQESYQENFTVVTQGTVVTSFDVLYKRHSLNAQPVELPSDSSPSAPPSGNEASSARDSSSEVPPSGPDTGFEPKSQDVDAKESLPPTKMAKKKESQASAEKDGIKDMILSEIELLVSSINDSTNKRKTKWGVKKKTENLKAIASWLKDNKLNDPSQVLGVIYDVCAIHRHPAIFGGWGKTHSVKEFAAWFEGTFKLTYPQVQLPSTHANLKDLRNPTSINALLDGLNVAASKKPTL